MGTIYRICCTSCSQSPQSLREEVAGYVAMDDRRDGVVLPDGYLEFRRTDQEPVMLAHPIEESILEEHGGA